MGEKMTLNDARAVFKATSEGLHSVANACSTNYRDAMQRRAVEFDKALAAIDAHLTQPAQAVDVDASMVERALAHRAMQEDGAVWPDAYSEDERAAEREQMQRLLAAAHNKQGPKAYCRACQRAGMSNCGYFDECAGATCITCHRPFTAALPKDSNGAEGAAGWRPIATAPKDGKEVLVAFTADGVRQVAEASWSDDEDVWVCSRDGFMLYRRNEPTHWMPLPDAPQEDTPDAAR